MHCRQTILYGVFISPVHLVRADPSGLTDPVAICIISIGKAGSLLAIVELFRDQLVTLIILISVPLHNRPVQSFLHVGTVTHKVILERVDAGAIIVLGLRSGQELSGCIIGKCPVGHFDKIVVLVIPTKQELSCSLQLPQKFSYFKVLLQHYTFYFFILYLL